jgi:excisionase family DNA binding protein
MHSSTRPAILLLTPQQAAEALAISRRKLWGMTASGELPHIRLGRCLRYPIDDLQRWIDEQKKGGDVC